MHVLDSEAITNIDYSRADGLFDKALIPATFELVDGAASYFDSAGERQLVPSLSDADPDRVRSAIYTALKTEIGDEILNRALQDFLASISKNPGGKMLIITSSIAEARLRARNLAARGLQAAVATSDDAMAAKSAINQFKREPSCKILITVAMAYEGLDVPAITHIACLTRIRSKPWLEQAFARATRYDPNAGPWEEQCAVIVGPEDRLMLEVVDQMRQEQIALALDPDEPSSQGSGGGTGTGATLDGVVPLSSSVSAVSSFDFDTGLPTNVEAIRAVSEANGLNLDEAVLEELAIAAFPTPANDPPRQVSPREEANALRSHIEALVRRLAHQHDIEPSEVNRRLKRHFGKGRGDMTVDELKEVLTLLHSESE